MITSLKENEIFVFGSNLAGLHYGGAAKQAHEMFGAEMGVGEGLSGNCYAFPTLDSDFRRLSRLRLELATKKLFKAATGNPAFNFLLTKVGCGIAGYDEAYIASLFKDCPANIIKPEDWK